MPRKIIKEMAKVAWQKEQDRIADLVARRALEDEEQQRKAKENLEAAKIAFEVAEDKVLAERVLFRATVCEMSMRERKTGRTVDMGCSCGYFKGGGHSCTLCDRWRKALYGGEEWVKYGSYNGFLC